jgi:polyvinyl alcohol dehydrogenase (cytochrome)
MVGFGQKSGIYWAFNPDNGKILWSSMVGPGSTLGGIEWGSATDGKRIYAAVSNGAHKPYPLIDGSTTTGGAWSALDAATGRLLWHKSRPGPRDRSGSVDGGRRRCFRAFVLRKHERPECDYGANTLDFGKRRFCY